MKRYLSILSLFFLVSCRLINPLYDEGDYIETIIEMEGFTQVDIHNIFNIEIITDTKSYMLYKGGENILKDMNHSVQGKVLKLDHQFINWVNNFKIPTLEIHVPELEQIDLHSSVNISSKNQLSGNDLAVYIHEEATVYEIDLDLNYAKFYLHTKGSVSGTLALSGECPLASYVMNGSTNIQASDLISKEISIAQNSLGDAHIYAENKITATIYNSGNIYYKGNPEDIEVKYIQINNQKASGKLIKE